MISGAVTVNDGGTLAPGGTNAVATLTVSNTVEVAEGGTLQVDIQTGGCDVLDMVSHQLSIENATLEVAVPQGFAPAAGTVYTIAENCSPVTGVFSGLPDGAVTTIGSVSFTIHYDDDSITLTARNPGTVLIVR